MRFKTIIATLCLSMFTCLNSTGQQASKSTVDLSFVYITHDVNTPVQALCNHISNLYDKAIEDSEKSAVIFYLANGSQPVVCSINTGKNDNPSAFKTIISELQTKRSHDIDPATDMVEIQKIFSENEVVSATGHGLYKSFTWQWYLNSTFWELEYNKTIFGPVYYIFDMGSMLESDYLNMVIFHGENDPMHFDEKQPFGPLYTEIDLKKIKIMTY